MQDAFFVPLFPMIYLNTWTTTCTVIILFKATVTGILTIASNIYYLIDFSTQGIDSWVLIWYNIEKIGFLCSLNLVLFLTFFYWFSTDDSDVDETYGCLYGGDVPYMFKPFKTLKIFNPQI